MKKITYSLALATALVATSCTSEDNIFGGNQSNEGKEMISFSMSDGSSSTRAGEGTRAGFTNDTKILMHIESQKNDNNTWRFTKTQATAAAQASGNDYSDVTFSDDHRRFWDDAHGRNSKLSIYAVAVPGKSTITDGTGTDDATIQEEDLSSPTSGTWSTDNSTVPEHKISWSVNKDQNSSTLTDEDLVYSNNIQADDKLGKDGVYWFDFNNSKWQPDGTAEDIKKTGATGHKDGRMEFRLSNTSDPSSAGKFDKGHMKFNHALSRITIKLIEGDGFNHASGSTDFEFTDATNKTINLYQMHYKGTLNLQTGKWEVADANKLTSTDPVRITPGGKTETEVSSVYTANYSCTAQVLPDYELTNGKTENVLDFTIDNNTYYIQNSMLWKALHDNITSNNLTDANSYKMEQGKNYVFTIKVDKKQIETVTATIVEWSNVEGAQQPINNGHINITTSVIGSGAGTPCSDLYLYRNGQDLGSINTATNYTAKQYQANYLTTGNNGIQPTAVTGSSNVWTTPWYFEDNKTAYHIRSINSTAYGTNGANVKNPDADPKYTYFELANGAQKDHDYHWGAPMSGDLNFKYDETNGYKSHLHQGITAINDGQNINISELHMMSNINVILKTTTGNDKVILRTGSSDDDYQYATVTLTRLYKAGTVDMGIGLVKTSGDVDVSEVITNPKDNEKYNNKYFKQDDQSQDVISETNPFTWAVVPQELHRTDGDTEDYYVGITIKTPDNNQYYVIKKLSEIKATDKGTSQNQTAGDSEADKVTRWYPNHSYTYTFTITKKGIENVTCTIANWSDVKAADTNIDLESKPARRH